MTKIEKVSKIPKKGKPEDYEPDLVKALNKKKKWVVAFELEQGEAVQISADGEIDIVPDHPGAWEGQLDIEPKEHTSAKTKKITNTDGTQNKVYRFSIKAGSQVLDPVIIPR